MNRAYRGKSSVVSSQDKRCERQIWNSGDGDSASSNDASATYISSAKRSSASVKDVPQRPQKVRRTPDDDSYSVGSPERNENSPRLNAAQAINGAPTECRQLRQWQYSTMTVCPDASNCTSPHRHPPALGIVFSGITAPQRLIRNWYRRHYQAGDAHGRHSSRKPMSASGQQRTSSKIVSDVRFGAVSGRKTPTRRNSGRLRLLSSGKQTSQRGPPNVC